MTQPKIRIKVLYIFVLIVFIYFIYSCVKTTKSNSNNDRIDTIVHRYDTSAIKISIDSCLRVVPEIKNKKTIPMVFDENWGEPFELDHIEPYIESKEDSLQCKKNMQIWQDSVKQLTK